MDVYEFIILIIIKEWKNKWKDYKNIKIIDKYEHDSFAAKFNTSFILLSSIFYAVLS